MYLLTKIYNRIQLEIIYSWKPSQVFWDYELSWSKLAGIKLINIREESRLIGDDVLNIKFMNNIINKISYFYN